MAERKGVLNRPVRDTQVGQWHQPGEIIIIRSVVKRADFDPRQLVNVLFQDGSLGGVFREEYEELAIA